MLELSTFSIEKPLSSVTTYMLNINDASSIGNCDEDKCLLSRDLGWYAPTPCQLKMVCNDLRGNICGDYGYNLKLQNKTMSICRANQLYSHQIYARDMITVEFWYTQDVGDFKTQCYLWCLSNEDIKPQSNIKLSPEVMRTH